MTTPSEAGADVWVTGVGLHSAFGDLDQTWTALQEGRSAVKRQGLPSISEFPAVPVAASGKAPVRPYLPDRKLAKYMNPTTEFAVVAAGQALQQAGLSEDAERKADTALFVTTNLIAFDVSAVAKAIESAKGEDGALDMARMGGEGWRRCHPLMPFKMLLNMPLGLVSIVFGLRGANAIVYPTPDQAGLCLDTALRGIRAGRFSRALVGATAHNVDLLPLSTYRRLGRLADSPEAAQTYQPGHRGYALGDGAGFVLVESDASVRSRGARPLAKITSASVARSWHGGGIRAAGDLWAADNSWAAPDQTGVPDIIVSTGSLDETLDAKELALTHVLWPKTPPQLVSFDGRLGYLGAAALMGGACLAVKMLNEAQQLSATDGDPLPAAKEIWTSSSDPDGAAALLKFEAVKGGAT